ncbi:uncharacterized protein LOC119743455 [Patiria miniata]|uniref:Uncharacterized protein n=1 Tax=Patiria miniata TaxID=46514 RepID=A0A914BI69_PATMI|nr:uncharacterized protein LOC119743455 [Patiria miniata]
MSRSKAQSCPKFNSNKDVDDLGAFEEICSCNWRQGLVHRPGEIAKPEFCSSAHQSWSTPLAGWFDALPSGTTRPTPLVSTDRGVQSSTPRKSAPQTNNHNGKSARSSQRTPSKPSTKSAGNPRDARHAETRFEHRLEASEYIKEYRERHVLRLVGSDGCPVKDGNSAFGKNLPDPYAFKSDNFRKMYSRLQDFMKRRPKRTLATGAPFALQEHRLPTPPSEIDPANEKKRPDFSFSDEVQTNFSDVFSPAFQRPKDMVFRPFICGSGSGARNVQGPAKLRYSHSAKRTGGSLPNIAREPDVVRFPMPAYVVTDSGNVYQDNRLGTPPKPGLASQMDLRLLEPKSANGNRTKTNRVDSKPNIMSAEFDSAMIQFLQKAKQNLERVREQRIRKEAIDKGRLVSRRGKRSDLVVTPGKQRAMKSNTTATDMRRIDLGVSQS